MWISSLLGFILWSTYNLTYDQIPHRTAEKLQKFPSLTNLVSLLVRWWPLGHMKPRGRNCLKTKHFRFSFPKFLRLWFTYEDQFVISYKKLVKIRFISFIWESRQSKCAVTLTSCREHLFLFVTSQKLSQLLAITYNNRKSTDEYDCFTKKRRGNTIFPFSFCILHCVSKWREEEVFSQVSPFCS